MIEFYVDPTHGSDMAGDGTSSNPYKTVSNTLTKLTNDSNIYLIEGTHTVHSLVDITSSSYIINYIGKGLETVIEVEHCYTCGQFRNKTTFNNCVMRPTNSFGGDVRTLSYTNDNVEIRFNYVLFTRSLNNSYPTEGMFYFHNNNGTFLCNKYLKNCTFINDRAWIVGTGSATYENCVTNWSAISNYAALSITGCLYNQTFNAYYELQSDYLNKSHGIYAGWLMLKMLILANDKDYYTIKSGDIVKADYGISEAFDASDLKSISRDNLKRYLPCRFILFNNKECKNMIYNINNNCAFVLINATNIDMDNIRLKSKHKMLVSDDLKTWDNYYDGRVSDTVTIDKFLNEIDNLKKYLRAQSKPVDFINKKYNYILLQLNENEAFDRLCETLYADYKRFDFESEVILSTGVDKKITIKPAFNAKEIIVKLMHKNSITIQNSLGAW